MKKTNGYEHLCQIAAALCIGLAVAGAVSAYADKTACAIADSVIRLHVIANSNSEQDQRLKLFVRDEVTEHATHLFAEETDISAARLKIENSISRIQKIAEEAVAKQGYDYDVRVSLGKSDFPTKTYGNVTLPAGTYEALKIEIGEGSGQNWWCVMFPPLCFVDAATVQLPEQGMEILKSTLSEGEYKLITEKDSLPVELRFKVFEIWQTGKIKLKNMLASIK